MTQTGRPALLAALRALIGERATDAAAVREAHGRSEAYHAPHPPDVVAFPETTAHPAIDSAPWTVTPDPAALLPLMVSI